MLGKTELILLVAAVILVLFVGGKKLPELARGIGQAGKELRKGFTGDVNADDEVKSKKDAEDDKPERRKIKIS